MGDPAAQKPAEFIGAFDRTDRMITREDAAAFTPEANMDVAARSGLSLGYI
jgi:hypothetical protein